MANTDELTYFKLIYVMFMPNRSAVTDKNTHRPTKNLTEYT